MIRQSVRERHPLKQGLKPYDVACQLLGGKLVRERHPLKQGLKLFLGQSMDGRRGVRERHPLKQGLKQKNIYCMIPKVSGQRKTSIKTRIETGVTALHAGLRLSQRKTSIKTRIETVPGKEEKQEYRNMLEKDIH